MTLSESRIFFICSVLEKLPTIVSTHLIITIIIIIIIIIIIMIMTKYQGNYEETARNLPPNGKASEMYVAYYPSPNLHFYFDDHSLQFA